MISTDGLLRPNFSGPTLFTRYSFFLLGAVNLGFEAGSTSDVQVITTTTHSGWYYFMSSLTFRILFFMNCWSMVRELTRIIKLLFQLRLTTVHHSPLKQLLHQLTLTQTHHRMK